MKLRYWIAEVKPGTVVGEITPSGSVDLTAALGGGSCALSVSVEMLAADGVSVDWAAVQRVVNWTRGGLHTLVVTDDDKRCLGEWVLMSRARATDSGIVPVRGMGWEAYPTMRSTNMRHRYDNISQMIIAKELLERAFISFNDGMNFTIPTVPSSVTRSMDYPDHSAYYSDLLEEISAPEDGFEWCVDIAPVWDGDRLVSVTRTVAFGQPILARPSPVVIEAGEADTRHGNAVIEGGDDFARYAGTVYAIGAGEGAKQPWESASSSTLRPFGYLGATRNVSYPGVSDRSTLQALAQGEVEQAQDLRDPYQATVRVDELETLPRVGTQIRLLNTRSLGFPEGLDEQVRVGQVQYSSDGAVCEFARIQAI